MAGIFELFNDEDAQYAFRLKSPAGLVLAVSGRYPDKESAVQGHPGPAQVRWHGID